MASGRLSPPNLITLGRILACPVLFFLVLSPRIDLLFTAFVLFLLASLSDLWDGFLARKYGWVTEMGKLLDPLADKLLLLATLIPFYLVSRRPDGAWEVPGWGELPLWVLLVLLGREAAVTLFRSWAARKGEVISAGASGKAKAFVQNLFSGSLILWYVVIRSAEARGWDGAVWALWDPFHRGFVAVSLAIALLLTVYSMGVYLWKYRFLWLGKEPTV